MQKEIQNKKIQNKSGFSLVEVIISIFLITFGIIASVELLTKGLKESMDSRDQLIAVGLAQEGVELVRNVRDNNWVQTTGDSFTDFPAANEEICRPGFTSSVNSMNCGTPASGTGDDVYRYSSGFYGVSNSLAGSTRTKFQRRIIIAGGGGASSERQIYSVVTWGGNITSFSTVASLNNCNVGRKCVYTQTTLSNWGEEAIN